VRVPPSFLCSVIFPAYDELTKAFLDVFFLNRGSAQRAGQPTLTLVPGFLAAFL